ncbi:MAG: hypothetical protein ACLPN1_09790 [Dissulfurispiraceae bacterium]
MEQYHQDVIVQRMLIRDRTQDVLMRIVDVDNFMGVIWLCNVDDDSWPRPMEMSRLIEELDPKTGQFQIEPDDQWAYPRVIASKGTERAADRLQEERYDLIEPLITGDNVRLILNRRDRKKLIDQRLKEVNSSRQTIAAVLKLWCKRGMTLQAVRPDYAKCGAPGKTRNPTGDKKTGRPRTIATGTGISINDKLRKLLKVAANFWLRLKKPTFEEAIDRICRLHFSKAIKDQNGRIIDFDVEPDKKPTARQLQYFIQKNYPYSIIRRRRYGERNWNLNERALPGTADSDIQGPGDQFLIDATVADVYLRSQFDLRRIVGRPIIYFVIDAFSSLIVGVYVGFEGPSWIGAMMALVNMVTPKIEFCRQYGIEIEESEWPSHHACRRLGADRGELMSVDLGKNITKSLHIQIENPGSGRPDLKALVERSFGIVPAKFRQFTPGYVEKDFNQRGAHDYRLEARLTLRQFTQFVIGAILEHNFTPIRDKRMPAAMITDGFEASPIDLWQWGVNNRSGSLNLHLLTVEEVAVNVMPTAEARVTANGIRLFKGGFYSCATAVREEWFEKARRTEWNVTMSFDPRKIDHAYLRDSKLPRGYEVCTLMERSNDYSGISLFEIEELALARKKTEAANKNDRQRKRILNDQRMADIQKEANKAAKAVDNPDASKAAMTAGLRDNKAQEKEINRVSEGFDLANDSDIGCHQCSQEELSVASSTHAISSDLALLKEKAKQREGGIRR